MDRVSNKAGAVILAAGESRRMTTPKSFLSFNENSTFLEQILDTYYQWGCNEIIVVMSKRTDEMTGRTRPVPPAVSTVMNHHPEYERYYSVKLGLGALKNYDFCFVQDVDNPFIDADILDVLFENRDPDAYVSPVFDGKGGHPVLLNRKNINFIRNYQENSANLKEVLNTMDRKKIEMKDDRILININTPEEYERLFNVR